MVLTIAILHHCFSINFDAGLRRPKLEGCSILSLPLQGGLGEGPAVSRLSIWTRLQPKSHASRVFASGGIIRPLQWLIQHSPFLLLHC